MWLLIRSGQDTTTRHLRDIIPCFQPHMKAIVSSQGPIVRAPLKTPVFPNSILKDGIMLVYSKVKEAVIILLLIVDVGEAKEAVLEIGTNHTRCTNSMGLILRSKYIHNEAMEKLNE